MKSSSIRLATENGKRVGKVAKAKRLAAEPATEAARLRRCIMQVRIEAERQRHEKKRIEALLQALFVAACSENTITTRALAREALIEVPAVISMNCVVRFCEMAEEGTLCA